MYTNQSTLPPGKADLFGSEVNLGPLGRLPALDCVDVAIVEELKRRANQLTATTPETALWELLDLVAGPTCTKAYSDFQADQEITTVLAWFAWRRDHVEGGVGVQGRWFEGVDPVDPVSGLYTPNRGRVAEWLRTKIYATDAFANYLPARQPLAARRAARLKEKEPIGRKLDAIDAKLERLGHAWEEFPPGAPRPSATPPKEPSTPPVPSPEPSAPLKTRKGDHTLFNNPAGGLHKCTSVMKAAEYGGVGLRAITRAMALGSIRDCGRPRKRQPLVEDVIHYFTPEKYLELFRS